MIKSRLSLEQADVSYRRALQDAFPSLSLDVGASHSWTADYGRPADRFHWRAPTYDLTLRLSLPPLFNVYSQVQAARIARSSWRGSRLAAEDLVRSIREEVYQAHIELLRALRSYEISLRKEDISKRNLDVVMEQYNLANTDALALSQARLDYVQAQTEKMGAFHDVNINRARYQRATGERIWRQEPHD